MLLLLQYNNKVQTQLKLEEKTSKILEFWRVSPSTCQIEKTSENKQISIGDRINSLSSLISMFLQPIKHVKHNKSLTQPNH